MVQLKYLIRHPTEIPVERFNSCMVQLKSFSVKYSLKALSCFNSCMVQLKLFSESKVLGNTYVLIPVWCN